MLARLRDLAARRVSFAFESTLASRTFARWLGELATHGYGVHVVYVWLRSPKLAIRRVKRRVREGGHSIPDEVIERRYARSCGNLLELYLPLAESWRIIDNSGRAPVVVAYKKVGEAPTILLPTQWSALHEAANRNLEDPAEDV
jgi:predicted ABC-type ATPase